MDSNELNKALVRRFYEEIDKGNMAMLDELVAEDYIAYNPPAISRVGLSTRRAETDLPHVPAGDSWSDRIEQQIADGHDGHKVVTRLTSIGKHEGDLPGASRTGNDLKMTSITIHRIANGKLVEKWPGKDVLGFLQQIGVIPSSHG
jgi:predicted ester cyclase